ncbi:MAG TPA: TIGR03435 family protein [Bryobacteraceae bacterium]|nr:TIGR03435 family protein [Bryobacteraceae bacterium]
MNRIILILPAAAVVLAAQTFEVAAIKPSAPGLRGDSITTPGAGTLRASGATLKNLIASAWHIENFQISGGPGWISTDRFDVNARAGSPVPGPQLRPMLQALLADRFSLKTHMETRTLPMYDLVLAKNGPKLARPKDAVCPDPPRPRQSCGGLSMSNRSHIYGEQAPVSDLIDLLKVALGRNIEDKTGLTAKYDIQLNWTPDETLFPGIGSERPDAPVPELDGTSLFTALQEQLGLKLEARKGPVEVIVIDHAEKPGTN